MLVPCGNNTVLETSKTSSALCVNKDGYENAENNFNELGYEILTFTGNGLLNRNIFQELGLKYNKYNIKSLTECTDWNEIFVEYPLEPNQNKNGSLYLLIGFESKETQEELSKWLELGRKVIWK